MTLNCKMSSHGEIMKVSYQADLRTWVKVTEGTPQDSKTSEADLRKWTMRQVALLSQEIDECTLPELEAQCKKKGISVWAVKYYSADFFKTVLEKSRICAIEEIIEEIGTREWYSPHRLKILTKRKNEKYGLDQHHREISCDDIQSYDPEWFKTVFSQRYVSLPEIIERNSNPPRFRKVLD